MTVRLQDDGQGLFSFYFGFWDHIKASIRAVEGERWERRRLRESDLSEWQRSARDEGGYAEDIRREPQQDTGSYIHH